MSDGALSQEEIDALLAGSSSLDGGMDAEIDAGLGDAGGMAPEAAPAGPGAPSGLSEADQAALQTMLTETAQSQGSSLSILTGTQVTLGAPTVSLKGAAEAAETLPEELVEVQIDFTEGSPGEHSFLLSTESANSIAGLMMGQSGGELDDAALSAVAEAVSQITGSLTTSIGDNQGISLVTSPPGLTKVAKSEVRFPQSEPFVQVDYPLQIEGSPDSTLTELYALSVAQSFVSAAQGASGAQVAEAAPMADMGLGVPEAQAAPPQSQQMPAGAGAAFGGFPQEGLGVPGQGAPGQGAPAQGMPMQGAPAQAQQAPQMPGGAQMYPGQGGMQQPMGMPGMPGLGMQPPSVQSVQFGQFQQPSGAGTDQGNISLLMDVFMEMTVELGRTRKPIKEILGMGEGTIIELDKLAGEPVDILVNHKLIAKGEVVVIDENFGVRVTEIISAGIERLGNVS